MSGPQHHRHPLLDLEHSNDDDRRHGPVTFHDSHHLQRRLERRSSDRRRPGRADVLPSWPPTELGTQELCHDLRQPVAAAAVLAHVLGNETELSEVGRDRLTLLQHELARLGGMLAAHLDADERILVDVAELVRDVCASAAHLCRGPIEVLAEVVPLVAAHPVLLHRMVTNLVTNGQAAAGPTGRVRVVVEQSSSGVVVHVEDSGAAGGQPPASGYGLGLMIVESVAVRHGGALSCAPSKLGGLRISVSLPAVVPPQSQQDAL